MERQYTWLRDQLLSLARSSNRLNQTFYQAKLNKINNSSSSNNSSSRIQMQIHLRVWLTTLWVMWEIYLGILEACHKGKYIMPLVVGKLVSLSKHQWVLANLKVNNLHNSSNCNLFQVNQEYILLITLQWVKVSLCHFLFLLVNLQFQANIISIYLILKLNHTNSPLPNSNSKTSSNNQVNNNLNSKEVPLSFNCLIRMFSKLEWSAIKWWVEKHHSQVLWCLSFRLRETWLYCLVHIWIIYV